MGYTTSFHGSFTVTPPLKPEHAAYLRRFNETRRMKRDEAKCAAMPDPIRVAAGLPVGHDGAYFVGGVGFMGQYSDPSVVDNSNPPGAPEFGDDWGERARRLAEQVSAGLAQPSLWCQWVPSDDGTAIEWDGGEKFYEYVDWLQYLVNHFLKPWGYSLDGEVSWNGEEPDDLGVIYAEGDKVDGVASRIVNDGPCWRTPVTK